MRIFIGSSKEARDSTMMIKVAAIIERQGHEILRWDKPGLFPPGSYTLEVLENKAKEVDAALFIFNTDDKLWYREDHIVDSVRDNVILEYGLFCGNVSRSKVCICRANKAKMPSDLGGLTYVDLDYESRAELEIIEWLQRLTNKPDDISGEKFYSDSEKITEIFNRYTEHKKRLLYEAEKGNNGSRYALGLSYFYGNIAFEQNFEEAYKWTKLAADENYPPAQNLMGWLYYYGCGIEKQSFKKSFDWHKLAADNNYSSSCSHLAYMLKIGLGCTQNISEAIKYYDKAIALGETAHINAFGELYEDYLKDSHNAEKYYMKAANSSGDASYRLGMLYYYGFGGENTNYLEAGKWFSIAAEKGHTAAQHQLGKLYYYGNAFPQNFKEAMRRFEQAAEKGHDYAQYVLGYMYLHGLGVSCNDHMALKWFEKASLQGEVHSQRHAGDIYIRQGKYQFAFEKFKLAADQGDIHSMRRLGDLYALGLGCQMDYGTAIKYYQLAANAGDELAKMSLELQSTPFLY